MGRAFLYGVGSKDKYAALVDRSITDFVMPKGITVIGPNALQGCTNLINADITGAEEVLQSGMNNCTNLKTLVAGTPLKRIGSSAFSKAGANEATLSFDIILSSDGCTGNLGSAFRESKLRDISGKFVENQIGSTAFYKCKNLRNVDLRTGTFTFIASSAFEDAENGTVYLPQTVTGLSNYGFQNYSNGKIFFFPQTPPLAPSNTFSGTSNVKWYVPYNKVNTYRTATNWTVIASDINGFAAEGTFQPNDLLPTANSEGLTLTWYSDADFTTPITNAPSDAATVMLYCTAA